MTRAILFDLDGTLVDADHLHYEAWRRMVEPHGVALGLDRYRAEIMGFANPLILASLVPTLSLEAGEALVEAKEVLFRSLASELTPAAGLLPFLDWLDETETRYGVVTNAPRLNAEQELAGIGLLDRFEVVVIADDLPHAKPHPLPYLTGLDRLGASAERSVAFEDSLSGIRSARAAGMTVVGLTTSLPASRLVEEGATLAIADYHDPVLKELVVARLGLPSA